jgi:hypothetical protein
MAAWLRENGLDGIHSQERYWALQIVDNLAEIERWRGGLDESLRRRFNHPQAIWVNWRKTVKTNEPQHPRVSRQSRKGSSGKLVFLTQDMIRRGREAGRERFPHAVGIDWDIATRVILNAAIRDQNDLLSLIGEPKQPPAKPASIEMHA